MQQLREDLENAQRAVDASPDKSSETDNLRKEIARTESRVGSAKSAADAKCEAAQRQLQDALAVVAKHAKLRETLEADCKDLAKQLSATASADSAADKVAALKVSSLTLTLSFLF